MEEDPAKTSYKQRSSFAAIGSVEIKVLISIFNRLTEKERREGKSVIQSESWSRRACQGRRSEA